MGSDFPKCDVEHSDRTIYSHDLNFSKPEVMRHKHEPTHAAAVRGTTATDQYTAVTYAFSILSSHYLADMEILLSTTIVPPKKGYGAKSTSTSYLPSFSSTYSASSTVRT